ncbi:Sel1 repeat-containing protein [Nitzschia inconspicua]|uniref:Sel1 repeat-containing protein n=1 Tax=Nitzschia inconspicua TaxID=303405 RepID=A0A9K3Q6M1_9STRA|nr:Sel1 repeat-containing protein [Nitzschia inconspicua]
MWSLSGFRIIQAPNNNIRAVSSLSSSWRIVLSRNGCFHRGGNNNPSTTESERASKVTILKQHDTTTVSSLLFGLRNVKAVAATVCCFTSARFYSSSSSSTTTTSVTPNDGSKLYDQAMLLMEQADEHDKQSELDRSQRMYEAWQQSQEKTPKLQGVKVIKTLVRETQKQSSNRNDNDDRRREAMDLLHRAAYDFQHPEASVQLANSLLKQASSVNPKNNTNNNRQRELVVEAMDLFRTAGESGSRVGWYNLGHLLWTGFPPPGEEEKYDNDDNNNETIEEQIIVPADLHEAMEAFTKAIDLGDTDAMYLVGVHRLTQGGKENYLSGTKLIERAADAGHGGALYYLALLHLNGEPHLGLEPCSLEEFVMRLDKAVEAGNVDARFVRGHSYYHGTEGYPQNYKKALEDFLQAADLGHADAAVSAGAMYHNGVGAPTDQTKAFELYQLGGELGSEEGWINVVDCWRQGFGVPQSEDTARYIEETMLKGQRKKSSS